MIYFCREPLSAGGRRVERAARVPSLATPATSPFQLPRPFMLSDSKQNGAEHERRRACRCNKLFFIQLSRSSFSFRNIHYSYDLEKSL